MRKVKMILNPPWPHPTSRVEVFKVGRHLVQCKTTDAGEEWVIVEPDEVQPGPPRFVEQFVWMLLPRKSRDAIIGDAAEAYAETVKRYGRRLATLDYCKEVLFAIIGSLRMRAGRLIELISLLLKLTS
jgi:hypothetical protein